MSSITKQHLSSFRPNLVGNKCNYLDDYPDITLPTNKLFLCEQAFDKNIQNRSNGQHPAQSKGVTHVSWWNGQIANSNTTPKASLRGDGWFYNSANITSSEYSQMGQKEQNSLVSNFIADVKNWYGSTMEYIMLDGEAWNAGQAGLESIGFANFQAIMSAWTSGNNTRQLGTWALGNLGIQARYRNMYDSSGNQNVTVIGNLATEYFTGAVPTNTFFEAGLQFGDQFCYIINSDSKQMYGIVMEHEMGKRRYPTKKNLWSVWYQTEIVDSYAEVVGRPETYKNNHLNLNTPNGIVEMGLKPQPPLSLVHAYYVFGLFLADGVHDWEWELSGNQGEDVVPELPVGDVFYQLGEKTQGFSKYKYAHCLLTAYDYGYLARWQAAQCASILQANTSWGLIEYSVDGGTTWRTGNDLAPSWGYWRNEPIIRIKYNATNTEAVVIACNPSLNNASTSMVQNVSIRDVSKGLANTFKLVSNSPYVGKITL